MWKAFVSGNYFFLENTADNIQHRRAKSRVEIRKESLSSTIYSFNDEFNVYAKIPFADLTDGAGVAWADVATFETFINENTGFNSASGGSEASVFTIGGEWVFNSASWRGLGNAYNINEQAHSTIQKPSTFPFDAFADYVTAGFNIDQPSGHVIQKNGNVTSAAGWVYNSMAKQDLAFSIVLMRFNGGTGLLEAVDARFISGYCLDLKISKLSEEFAVPMAVLAGDVLFYGMASEIPQGSTQRLPASFTIKTEH